MSSMKPFTRAALNAASRSVLFFTFATLALLAEHARRGRG